MKATNTLLHFFKVPKNSVNFFFYINCYPNVSQGMYEFMHQVSCLKSAACMSFSLLFQRLQKVETLSSSLKGDRQQKML